MKNLLYVYTNGYSAFYIISNLRELGWSVKHSHSLYSTIDCWEENDGNFDCIIVNYNIPVLKFLEKELGRDIYTKVIVYSSHIEELKNSKYKNLTIIDKCDANSISNLFNLIKNK